MSENPAPASKSTRTSWIRIGLYLIAGFLTWEFLFIPAGAPSLAKAQALQMTSSGRQLKIAAQLDDADHAIYPVTSNTARDYIATLVRAGRLQEIDLRLLSGPHHSPPTKSLAELSEKNIAFIVYRVGPDDPPETAFLVSKPDVFKDLRIEVRKDGSAQVYKLSQSPTIASPLPKAIPPTLSP